MLKIETDVQMYADRRGRKVKDTVTAAALKTWKGGMVLQPVLNSTTSEYELADGTARVVAPVFIFTDGSRADVQQARNITCVAGPGYFKANNEAFVGNPIKGSRMGVGTAGNVGKMVIVVVSDFATLDSIIAECVEPADADGFALFKAIR